MAVRGWRVLFRMGIIGRERILVAHKKFLGVGAHHYRRAKIAVNNGTVIATMLASTIQVKAIAFALEVERRRRGRGFPESSENDDLERAVNLVRF